MARNNDDRLTQLGAAIGPPRAGYVNQPLAGVQRAVMQGGPQLWAESMHTQWSAGQMSPHGGGRELKLRALFRAIRMLEHGDEKQQKKARDLSRFLESAWGLKQACVAIGGKDLDAVRALREAWGDAQLPPVDAFVNSTNADEVLIDAIVRRLG